MIVFIGNSPPVSLGGSGASNGEKFRTVKRFCLERRFKPSKCPRGLPGSIQRDSGPAVAELGHLVRASDVNTPIQRWFQYREGYTLNFATEYFLVTKVWSSIPFVDSGQPSSLLVVVALLPSALMPIPWPLCREGKNTKLFAKHNRRHRDANPRPGARSIWSCADVPLLRIIEKIFHPEILDALLCLQGRILSISNDKTRDFVLLGWIAILEDVSNVFREGNGIKYRNRIRNGNTYTVSPYAQWAAMRFPEDKFQFVKHKLVAQLKLMLEDIRAEKRSGVQPVAKHGDAEDLRDLVSSQGASLALFSPPYCNCFNYIKAYKVELWMSEFIRTYADIGKLTALGIDPESNLF